MPRAKHLGWPPPPQIESTKSCWAGFRIVAANPGDKNYPDEECSAVVNHNDGVIYLRAEEYDLVVAELKHFIKEVH